MNDRDTLMTKLQELQNENTKLRFIIADSNLDCIYCRLPKTDLSKCKSGFPGCGRMDDLINDPNGPAF